MGPRVLARRRARRPLRHHCRSEAALLRRGLARPLEACHNPWLDRTVTPSPSGAEWTPNVPCARVGVPAMRNACVFGAGAPKETVVILGDSHGEHWRAAMRAMALRNRWRVIEF